MPLAPVLPRLLSWARIHRTRLLLLFAGVLLPLWLFGALADEVLDKEPLPFDRALLLFARAHHTPALDRVMLFFSLVGYRFGVIPASIAVLLALLFRRRRGDLFFWIVALGGTSLLNISAKAFFGRIRPNLWLSIAPETTYSFPSGHAMGSMALVTAVLVLAWPTRWRWPALILGSLFVLLVGVSRVYLGVHYPSDILAGWVASLAWVLGVSAVLYGRAAKPTPQTQPDETG